MRKIPVTRQFFEASGLHHQFFETTKNPFLDMVQGSMCTKFQVSIVFRLAWRPDKHKYTDTHIYIQVKIGIPSTGCPPPVDFEKLKIRNVFSKSRCTVVGNIYKVLKSKNGESKSCGIYRISNEKFVRFLSFFGI